MRTFPLKRGVACFLRTLIAVAAVGVFALGNAFAVQQSAVPPPAGATKIVRDTAANLWTLLAPTTGGTTSLWVLPADAPTSWKPVQIEDLPNGPWTEIEAFSNRTVVVTGPAGKWSFDPRSLKAKRTGVDEIMAASSPSKGPWRDVAGMPASNHDIMGAVLNGRMYVAGGLTANHGFPVKTKAFDELWALDPVGWSWQIAARFSQPRIYCATVAFEGRIWILGGDVLDTEGKRSTTTRVEIFDPTTQKLTAGPSLPFALQAPLAFSAGGRIWILGSRNRSERGQMASLGAGESAWRVESEALPHMWALAGTVLNDQLYACVPNTGLVRFDPATKAWTTIPGPTRTRSAQVAAWNGEIWIMGGCDITDWSETWVYNPAQKKWRTGPALPVPLAWGAAAVINDQLIVAGGAGLRGPAAENNYVFSDRTYALRRESVSTQSQDSVLAQGSVPRWSDSNLRGTGGPSLPFTTQRIFPHFKFGRLATILSIPPSSPTEEERLLVAEVHGPVWTFPNRPDVIQPDKMLDLPARFKSSTHTYALAFHPQYPKNPYVYVLYNKVEPKPAENVIARFTVATLDGVPTIDIATEQIILNWPSDGHNGGDVLFGPDGYLYISVGDRSSPGDPNNMGQRVDVIAGAILRIDVLHADPSKPYIVPNDNPFVGMENVRPEIWAYGLRNPWRMWFDLKGDLWVADNGDDSWESVHLIGKGKNYGWSVYEGTHLFKRTRSLSGPSPVLTPPVIELSHAEARSVIGGLLYRGNRYPALVGNNLFGDFVTGTVWAFQWNGKELQNYRKIAETRGATIAFGTDRAGNLLLVRDDGQIHQLVDSPISSVASVEFPKKLSGTGLFSDVARLAPAPGAIPYTINAELWSDGANAHRLLAIPGAKGMIPDPDKDGRWDLPDGSALARTLEIPTPTGPRRVETQLMYRESGTWSFYTYAWNPEQTDAELISEAGETRPVPGLADRTWRYASRSECSICHTAKTNTALGLTLAQLNRESDYSALDQPTQNQLEFLIKNSLLRTADTLDLAKAPKRVSPHDLQATLEDRARSYLDINCAHCHRAGGVGGRAAFQLMETLPLKATGVVEGRPLVPLLGPDARLIIPGHPEKSELMHRITLTEGGKMPLIGSEFLDKEGIELIRSWIAQMRQ
ncbi:MAG TPA: PQQ-dependent sugar dehydrogenase [Opitutaceae bacterium]|nr:PQQ-dependent sugar dehydrogenase [Opitutaceae bacterium]